MGHTLKVNDPRYDRNSLAAGGFRVLKRVRISVDIGVLARLEHLPELIAKARGVNARLLSIERAGQGCAIGDDLFDRLHQPYLREGQRTGALRFGNPRAMALAGTLCCVVHAVTGFADGSFAGLSPDSSTRLNDNQMSYDLRRLRLHGLIERIPGTNTYRTTDEGLRTAIFFTKLRGRLLGPLLNAAHEPPAPTELRRALTTIDGAASTPTSTRPDSAQPRENSSQNSGAPPPRDLRRADQ